MGLFSTVFTTLSCRQCSATHRCGVQFKTGSEDGDLPQCDELGRLPSAPPGTYEGIADAYCRRCRARWTRDEKEALFLALAAGVARGALTVRRGDIVRVPGGITPVPDANDDFTIAFADDRALSPEEITAAGRAADPSPGIRSFAAHFGDCDYVVFEGDARRFPTRLMGPTAFWDRLRSAVARAMTERGWAIAESPWFDVAVVVSADHVVTVG